MSIEAQLTMPLIYHYRGKQSDRDWIAEQMALIPDEFKHEVSKGYERVYMSGLPRKRKEAKEYLLEQVQRF